MKQARSLLSTLLAALFAAGMFAASAPASAASDCGKDPKQMTEADFDELYRADGGV